MAKDLQRLREQGDRIQEARLACPRPHTQEVFAEKVGVTLRAYQAWEGGESDISDENLPKLAAALTVSEDYITGRAPARLDESQLDRIEAGITEILGMLKDGALDDLLEKHLQAVRAAAARTTGRSEDKSASPETQRRQRPGA